MLQEQLFFRFINYYVVLNKNYYKIHRQNFKSKYYFCYNHHLGIQPNTTTMIVENRDNFPVPYHWKSKRQTYIFLIMLIIMCRGHILSEHKASATKKKILKNPHLREQEYLKLYIAFLGQWF